MPLAVVVVVPCLSLVRGNQVFLGQVCAPVSRLGSSVACVHSPGISGGSVAETSLRIAFSWLLPLVVVLLLLLFIVIIKGLSFVLAGSSLSLSRSYAMFILALSRFAFAGKVRSAGRRSVFAAGRAEIHNHSRSTFYLILDWLRLSLLVVVCRRCLPSMTSSASNSSSFLSDGALLLLRVEHLGFVDVFRHHGGLLIPHVSCHGVTTLHHFVSLAASLNLSTCRSISIRHGHVRFSRVGRSQSSRFLLLESKAALLLYSVSICGLGSLLSLALETAIQVAIAVLVNLPESFVEVVFSVTSHVSVDLGLERIRRLETFGDVAAVVVIGGVNLVLVAPPARVHIWVQRARSGPVLRLGVRVINLVPRGRAVFLGAFRRIFGSILAPRGGSTSHHDDLFGTL